MSLGQPYKPICEESASQQRPNLICPQVSALVTT